MYHVENVNVVVRYMQSKKKRKTLIHNYSPSFSMSGIPATFEADRNELYKMQTIQITKPTMLDVSKDTFVDGSLPPKKWWLHSASGLLATADHVK